MEIIVGSAMAENKKTEYIYKNKIGRFLRIRY